LIKLQIIICKHIKHINYYNIKKYLINIIIKIMIDNNTSVVENENENITIKTNLIDSGNDDNNVHSSDLSKLARSIEMLENFHHIEISKILKLNNVYLNENSNGIFVNLNKISYKTYQEISNYIDFVKKQENEINKDEKLKRNLQTTYFKDNKDK